jgi:hypothetical protein
MSVFLITFLSYNQVLAIANKLQNIAMLTSQQKSEIIQELKKVVPTCPVIIEKK